MAKPLITLRSDTDPLPLTYTELDTNFENLRDATLSITAGTGGTQVISDLNGNITLVAGTGVTLSGDNTAKTITINSTGGMVNPITEDLDLGSFAIKDTNSAVMLKSTQGAIVQSITYSDNSRITISPGIDDAAALATIFTNNTRDFKISNSVHALDLYNNTDGLGIALTAPGKDTYVLVQSGNLRLNPMTTAERDAITSPQNGSLIYNSTTGKFQGRAGGVWVDLH